MVTTTLRNNTESTVVLREGQVGLLRKVCDIQAGGEHKVRSTITATYKEYWCAVQPGSDEDKFILTSDDCIDWKEIEITSTDTVPKKFVWKGTVPQKPKSSTCSAGDSGSPSSAAAPPTLWSRLLSKFVWWKKPPGTATAHAQPESPHTSAGGE